MKNLECIITLNNDVMGFKKVLKICSMCIASNILKRCYNVLFCLKLLEFNMQRFAMDHMMQDHLIVGFASEKANPFREKTWSCEVL